MKGQIVAYIRVSTVEQNTARQLDGIPRDKTFTDKVSGKDTNRPEFQRMLEFLRESDTLIVHSMDRLSRNLDDLRRTVKELTARGIKVHFHKENLTFTGSDDHMSTLLLCLMGSLAEFERAHLKDRQREGIAIAKRKGLYKGRQPLAPDKRQIIKERVAAGDSRTAIAKDLKICRQTLAKYLKQ